MAFHGILFEDEEAARGDPGVPDCFADLNLDQIVAAATSGKDDYNLKPLFYRTLDRIETLEYRHAVLRDLEQPPLLDSVRAFAGRMRELRERLAQAGKRRHPLQKQAWTLDAMDAYCGAVNALADELAARPLSSKGFTALREYLSAYRAGPAFSSILSQTEGLKAELAAVTYCVFLTGASVNVRAFEPLPDYGADVEATFGKFRQRAAKDYRAAFDDDADMDPVQAQVLEFVSKLFPETFSRLERFCEGQPGRVDATLASFDREVQFYLAYLEYVEPLQRAGLRFCYPEVVREKDVFARQAFDLALAAKNVRTGAAVVCNDFQLQGPERVIVVTGPNQGGKTTFARLFGQLHFLAALGLPVPGSEARLFFFDRLFTHFEREEDIETLRGKLQDDLVRLRRILAEASPDSVFIANELFTSTSLQDAASLSRKVMERLAALDCLGVWVTFIDELSRFGPGTLSMAGTVVPGDPARRTFKIARKPADGLSYARVLAEKYGLTRERLRERLPR